uniref:Butyrophilin subfamily 2 member A2 n=1 Tax=Ictalurus punctatus TaxID=7998 RepID=W5UK18_ICTPU
MRIMFLCVTLLTIYSLMESQSEGLKVVGPDAPLVAVAGEDLVLPCFIKPNTSAVDLRVEWFKLDGVNSLVHLYNDHEDRNEKQAQAYKRRTSLFKEELQKGNASLKLSDLNVSDEGEYKCFIEDKSWFDDITVRIIVEVQGSNPVIMMESYDHSGGLNLVCESKGWNPEPKVLWMNREGDTLPAEDTQIHRDTEGFSVKHRITVYDYSDSNKFYCRLLQKHHMMETEVIINSKVFDAWKWVVGISVSACLIAVGSIVTAVICYKKELQKQKQKAASELQKEKENAASELQMEKEYAASELQKEKENAASELQMEKEYAELQRQRVEDEFKKKKKFAVDVTLDPDTAHPNLIVSADGKQVTHGDTRQYLPDTPQRFNKHVSVLVQQSFSSGRFYYEVQVRGKTVWALGVATESINRKGDIIPIPQGGFWTVGLIENCYVAFADPPVPLTLREKVEKVGVFVDYEEGLVSFYDVKSSSHIYSFTGQSFTEKLYPFFSPDLNYSGKNSAPLIISPVFNTE